MDQQLIRPLKLLTIDHHEAGSQRESRDSFDEAARRRSSSSDGEHHQSSDTFYEPLPEGYIRVLRLTGTEALSHSSGILDIAITCELETISMEDVSTGKQRYDALSYVWGSLASDRHVVCNGIPKRVTDNLYNALWHILTDPRDRCICLWVDAICINQADTVEKSWQVGMMSDIYRNAEIVTVWLGAGLEQSASGLDEFWNWVLTDSSDLTKMSYQAIRAGSVFLERCEWFRRSWTFQEFVLAREVQVRSGRYLTSWSRFCERSLDLTSNQLRLERGGHSGLTSGLRKARMLVSTIEKAKRTKLDELSLLMRYSADRVSSEPRDMVFSLLGLHPSSAGIVPDYTMSVASTFAQAAARIAHELGYLWFMTLLDLSTSSYIPPRTSHGPTKHVFEEFTRDHWWAVNSAWCRKSWILSLDSVGSTMWDRVETIKMPWYEGGIRKSIVPMSFELKLHSAQISVCGVLLRHLIRDTPEKRNDGRRHSSRYAWNHREEGVPRCISSQRIGSGSGEAVDMLDVLLQICQHGDRTCSCEGTVTKAAPSDSNSGETQSKTRHLPEWYKRTTERGEHVLYCLLGGYDQVVALQPVLLGEGHNSETPSEISFDLVGETNLLWEDLWKRSDSKSYGFPEKPSTPKDLPFLLNEMGGVYTRFDINGGDYVNGVIRMPDRGHWPYRTVEDAAQSPSSEDNASWVISFRCESWV